MIKMRRIKKIDKNGFSLLEVVITIIIIAIALSAIVESFITGSARSINIINEESAVNVVKQEMAELYYCRNGGSVSGVCSAFSGTTWTSPTSFYTSPLGPTDINSECFYTTASAQNVDFTDTNGSGTIGGSSSNFIQTIVQTGWFALSSNGTCPAAPAGCPGTPGSCPYVTLSTVYANY